MPFTRRYKSTYKRRVKAPKRFSRFSSRRRTNIYRRSRR